MSNLLHPHTIMWGVFSMRLEPLNYSDKYGEVKLYIRHLMDLNGISRYRLCKLLDITYEKAMRLYDGSYERADLDLLAKILFVFKCDLNDILFYIPPPKPEKPEPVFYSSPNNSNIAEKK